MRGYFLSVWRRQRARPIPLIHATLVDKCRCVSQRQNNSAQLLWRTYETRAMQNFWLDIFSVWWNLLQVHCFSKVADLAEELVIVTVLEKFYWTECADFSCSRPRATRGILTREQTSWWWDPDASVASWIYSTDLEYIKRESVPDIPVHRLPDSLSIYGRRRFNIPHASKPFHPWENTCGSSLILKTCESFDTCLNNASLWKV